jgi:hypothetical protein
MELPDPQANTRNDSAPRTSDIRKRLRYGEVLVGLGEAGGGVTFGIWGCVETVDHNASLAGIGALYCLFLGFLIAFPGWLLLRKAETRLWWQALPLTLLVLVVLARFG